MSAQRLDVCVLASSYEQVIEEVTSDGLTAPLSHKPLSLWADI